MRVLIIEDEIPAQRMLKMMLAEIDPSIEVVGCLNSVQSAVTWFQTKPHPELVLLDIQLSDGISFEILEQVTIDSLIIFTTAFDEYAIQAFKVNSLDFLLKPIEQEELQTAISKYTTYSQKFRRHLQSEINFMEIASLINNAKTQYRKRFLIQLNESFLQLSVEDTAFFMSENKQTSAITFDQKNYNINVSLQDLIEQLDPTLFFKVNRQLIINIKAIQKIHSYFQGKLVIKTKPAFSKEVIVGKDKAASFKRWLDQ
jgi:DNA-binding LytR/AlgR family response regulator